MRKCVFYVIRNLIYLFYLLNLTQVNSGKGNLSTVNKVIPSALQCPMLLFLDHPASAPSIDDRHRGTRFASTNFAACHI